MSQPPSRAAIQAKGWQGAAGLGHLQAGDECCVRLCQWTREGTSSSSLPAGSSEDSPLTLVSCVTANSLTNGWSMHMLLRASGGRARIARWPCVHGPQAAMLQLRPSTCVFHFHVSCPPCARRTSSSAARQPGSLPPARSASPLAARRRRRPPSAAARPAGGSEDRGHSPRGGKRWAGGPAGRGATPPRRRQLPRTLRGLPDSATAAGLRETGASRGKEQLAAARLRVAGEERVPKQVH